MKASRRRILGGAVAVVLGGARAGAQIKASQAEAQYQPTPRDNLSCAACQLFRPPHACAVVAGEISPHGWCKFFTLPD